MFKKFFSSTSIALVPRKYRLPNKYNAVSFPEGWEKTPKFKRIIQPQLPTPQQLSAPLVSMKTYMASLPRKTHLVPLASQPKLTVAEKLSRMAARPIRFSPRYPLPTTFSPGQTYASWLASMRATPEPITKDPHHYPYTFYEVTMIRGLIGLPRTTRKIAQSLGLRVVNQVVYHQVSEANAGKLLKIKELIRLRLVNTIPDPIQTVPGYKKVGNILGKTLE